MNEHKNEISALETILILLYAVGLAVLISFITFSVLSGYSTLSIIISLAINLILSYAVLIFIIKMGESLIEDIVKATLLSLFIIPSLLWDYKFEEFIKCISLSLASGAWYAVVLRFLPGLGDTPQEDTSIDEADNTINTVKDKNQKIIEKSLRRRKRKQEKRKKTNQL
ncbi:hypothetical protein ACFLZG_07870 [Thermodesulfobacteriota bacterium]